MNRLVVMLFFRRVLFYVAWLYRSVRAKFTVERIFLIIFSLLLSIWTFENLYVLETNYNDHYTTITLDHHRPALASLPSITICGPGIFSPVQLALHFSEFNETYQQYLRDQQSKSHHSKPTPANKRARYALYRKYESLLLSQYSAIKTIEEYSLRPEMMLKSCVFHPVSRPKVVGKRAAHEPILNWINCSEVRPVLESIYEGRKCFTYFSNVMPVNTELQGVFAKKFKNIMKNSELKEIYQNLTNNDVNQEFVDSTELDGQMHHDLSPSIKLEINLQWQIWSFLGLLPWVSLAVHPSNVLAQKPDITFFHLQLGAYHQVTYDRSFLKLMHFPWRTLCMDYFFKAKKQALPELDLPLFNQVEDEGNANKWFELFTGAFYSMTSNEESKLNKIRKDNSHNYHNRYECLAGCVRNETAKKNNGTCVNYYAFLTKTIFEQQKAIDQKICAHDKQEYRDYRIVNEACLKICPSECVVANYETRGVYLDARQADRSEEIDMDSDAIEEWLTCVPGALACVPNKQLNLERSTEQRFQAIKLSSYNLTRGHAPIYKKSMKMWRRQIRKETALVSINLAPTYIEVIRHRPSVSSEEFFGSAGGHLGIWIDLSLFAFVSFWAHLAFKMIVNLLRQKSRLSKWRKSLREISTP